MIYRKGLPAQTNLISKKQLSLGPCSKAFRLPSGQVPEWNLKKQS